MQAGSAAGRKQYPATPWHIFRTDTTVTVTTCHLATMVFEREHLALSHSLLGKTDTCSCVLKKRHPFPCSPCADFLLQVLLIEPRPKTHILGDPGKCKFSNSGSMHLLICHPIKLV
jgi:hypothetical protein